jgi:hypothetical protein
MIVSMGRASISVEMRAVHSGRVCAAPSCTAVGMQPSGLIHDVSSLGPYAGEGRLVVILAGNDLAKTRLR